MAAAPVPGAVLPQGKVIWFKQYLLDQPNMCTIGSSTELSRASHCKVISHSMQYSCQPALPVVCTYS